MKKKARAYMTVAELRRVLEGQPDDAPVLVPGPDHSYVPCRARAATALLEEGGTWTEDHGETVTSAAVYGERRQVVVIR